MSAVSPVDANASPFTPPPGNPRFPLFDGLRGIAAVGVLVGHCAGVSGAAAATALGHAAGNLQMGVTVFFVISGFLLYRPFVSADLCDTERPSVGTFYGRRALRIVPGYWFALVAVSLLPGVASVFGPGWWRYFLLVQNYSGFDFTFARGIEPAWSLSVEVAFYAVLPVFAFVMTRLGGRRPSRRLTCDLLVLAALALISSGLRAWLLRTISANPLDPSPLATTAILTLPLYFTWFAVGMAFASLSAWSQATGQVPSAMRVASGHPGIAWLLAGAAFVVLAATTQALPSGEVPAHHVLTGLVAGLLVFPAAFPVAGGGGLPAAVLSARPVAWVGLVSYGIYLWATPLIEVLVHEGILSSPAPFLVLAAAALVLSTAAGAFSFYAVERPFLRLKSRLPGGHPPVATPAS